MYFVDISNDIFEVELQSLLILHYKIESIIKELNPPILSINGIGVMSCAGIISQFFDLSIFKSADACVAFSGIEPSILQSKTESHTGHMVKHGFKHLRYFLLLHINLFFIIAISCYKFVFVF